MSATAGGLRADGYGAKFPHLLGLTFMVLICFPAVGELPGSVSAANVLMFAGLPFWFCAAVKRQKLIFDRTATQGVAVILSCMAFLTFWAFLSVLDSGAPIRSGRVITTLLGAFAIFLLFAGTLTSGRLGSIMGVLCFTLALTCLLSFAAYFEPNLRRMIFYSGDLGHLSSGDRASGFFRHPNQFGMAISTLLPVAAAATVGQFGRRYSWLGCLIALLLGLIASGSKTNLLISSATLAFILLSYPAIVYTGGKRVFMIVLSLFMVAVLLASFAVLLNTFNPRAVAILLKLTEEDGEVASLLSRHELWLQSIEQFQRDPVFGQGAGHPLGTPEDPISHSHNVFLDYLRSMGAPGLLGLTMALLTALTLSINSILLAFKAKGSSTRDRMLCIGLATGSLAYIVANLSSDSMGPSTSPFFWTVLFLGLAVRVQLQSRSSV